MEKQAEAFRAKVTAGEAAEPPIQELENIMLEHVEKEKAKQPLSEEDKELRDLMGFLGLSGEGTQLAAQ